MLSCVSFKQPIAKVCPLLFNFRLLVLRRDTVKLSYPLPETVFSKIEKIGDFVSS